MAQHSHYGCPRSPSSESASTSRRPASKASQEGHQHPRQASALSSHLPIVCVLIYGLLSVVLVVQTQDDRWLLGDITFGVLFFAARCVLMFAFSDQIYATHHRLPIIPPSSTMSDDDHNRNNHRTYACMLERIEAELISILDRLCSTMAKEMCQILKVEDEVAALELAYAHDGATYSCPARGRYPFCEIQVLPNERLWHTLSKSQAGFEQVHCGVEDEDPATVRAGEALPCPKCWRSSTDLTLALSTGSDELSSVPAPLTHHTPHILSHDAVQVCYQCLRLRSRPRAAHPSLPSLVASFTPVSAVTSTAYVKAHGILPRRSVNLLTETDLNAIDAMVSSAVDSHYRRTGLPQRLIHSSASIPIHAGFYKSVDEL
ncbi:unnamed protein product [Tilletia caries]|nr:unnamed protein product [Tilletia caries]